MKCENIRELMSAYIDNEINEVDKAKFDKHIAQCPQCKQEYELLKNLVIECSEIDEAELPEDFREELHNKLLEAKAAKLNKSNKFIGFMKRNTWKVAGGAAAAVIILAISLNSLGGGAVSTEQAQSSPAPAVDMSKYELSSGGAESEAQMRGDMGIASVPEAAPSPKIAAVLPDKAKSNALNDNITFSKEMAAEERSVQIQGFPDTNQTPEQVRKIIKNGNISLKVTDVQARIQEITALVEQSGGYVESSYVDNIEEPVGIVMEGRETAKSTTKIANITIRVPAERFESTFQTVQSMGEVVNHSTNSNDVTTQYRDIEARVENLKVQEKHLQEIMAKATTVEDTLKVEAELNRVRTEIDLMTGNLKNWDRMVEYSTIYINMTEVKEAELEKVDVPGVWQKAQQGFVKTINNIRNGLEGLFVFLISALPYIVILGAGSLLVVLWIKRKNK